MKERRKAHSVGKTILMVVLIILLLAGAGYFVYAYFRVREYQDYGNARNIFQQQYCKIGGDRA